MTIQILSLIIALLAVVIGPIITYRITRKNLEFQFRSIIKEHWVNKLEDVGHSFLFSTSEWTDKYPRIKNGLIKVENSDKEIERMNDSIRTSIVKLELLLDIKKIDQSFLLDNVAIMADIINSRKFDEESISVLREKHNNIIDTLQKIFHQERSKMADIFR
jgi:hypothetical protein